MVLVLYRVNLVLGQEFPEEEPFIKNPLGYAVSEDIDFIKFRSSSWKAVEALSAAMRFRTFYKRFMPLISPRDARLFSLLVLAIAVGIVVVVQIMNAGPRLNGTIGAIVTIINLVWLALIEHGKSLKKSMDKLRVS